MSDDMIENPIIENEVSEPVEVEEELTSNEPENETEVIEQEPDELPDEVSKRIGAALSNERKRLKAQASHENAELRATVARLEAMQMSSQPVQNQNGILQDPLTGKYVTADSIEGQIIIREQHRASLYQQEAGRAANMERVRTIEQFQDKVNQGFTKFSNYDSAYEQVNNLGTPAMVDAMAGTSNPASIINYLGKNSTELQRISKLSPIQQQKEIYKLEDKLIGKPKLISKAPAPTGAPGVARNTSSDAGQNSIQARVQELRKQQSG